jgi:hypothetical protein
MIKTKSARLSDDATQRLVFHDLEGNSKKERKSLHEKKNHMKLREREKVRHKDEEGLSLFSMIEKE